jgi:hypothetical protein
MLMMVLAIAQSLESRGIPVVNERSILSVSIGKRFRYDRLEYPVPKSSSDSATPCALMRSMMSITCSISCISVLSVISSSSHCGCSRSAQGIGYPVRQASP